MSAALLPMTAEQFADLCMDQPADLVRGFVAPRQFRGMAEGIVCTNTICLLENWRRRTDERGLLTCGAGIVTQRNPDTVRGPAVSYLSPERADQVATLDGYLEVGPDLVVEILNWVDDRSEELAPIEELFAMGVREFWFVEPVQKTVTVCRPDQSPKVLSVGEQLTTPTLPGLSIAMDQFFHGLPIA